MNQVVLEAHRRASDAPRCSHAASSGSGHGLAAGRFASFALALLSSPGVALASDYTGFGTLLIGYPCAIVLVLANLVFGAARSPGPVARTIHAGLSWLCLLGILLMLHDAFALLERAGNGGEGSGDAMFFLLLAGGGLLMFVRNLMKRRGDPDTR